MPTTTQGWFGSYWTDSEMSHPSLSTAAEHHTGMPHDAMLGSTVLLALSAYSELLPGDPWAGEIERFSAALVESIPAR